MKMLRDWLTAGLKLLAGIAMAAAICSPAMALRVDMYAIGNWSSGNCDNNPADNRPSWPGMAHAWYSQMGAQGHINTGNFTDGNTTLQRFCDPNKHPAGGCQDWWYVDWSDAAITAFHGGNDGNAWSGLMRWQWNGGECNTRFGGAAPNMAVGDTSLKILHASSCRSAEDTYLPNLRHSMDKGPGHTRLHMFTGFHGCMWISSSYNNDYKQTAIDGQWGGIANSWVRNHYKRFGCAWFDPFNWFHTCTEQCPVAYTIGTSSSGALTRLFYESYGNALAFGNPAGSNWYAWMGYVGCQPACVGHAFNP